MSAATLSVTPRQEDVNSETDLRAAEGHTPNGLEGGPVYSDEDGAIAAARSAVRQMRESYWRYTPEGRERWERAVEWLAHLEEIQDAKSGPGHDTRAA